ncbi:MAG: iron-sulfur cluster assembly accessory protein [Gammaproteobacteria bacterium]|nr:iron-sulfur cluster assembly accessory protein [Gammaproteobacteria bacterium]
MAIQLTESAVRHVQSMLDKRNAGIGLRLGTRKSGCSGYAYVVEYADYITDEDTVFESSGVKIVVDAGSLPHLDGITIDYVRTSILNSGFEFINPNVTDSCGCGESIAFRE